MKGALVRLKLIVTEHPPGIVMSRCPVVNPRYGNDFLDGYRTDWDWHKDRPRSPREMYFREVNKMVEVYWPHNKQLRWHSLTELVFLTPTR